MRVVMTFTFTDEDRERITRFRRDQMGCKGLPRLATRKLLRDWIGEEDESPCGHVEDYSLDEEHQFFAACAGAALGE